MVPRLTANLVSNLTTQSEPASALSSDSEAVSRLPKNKSLPTMKVSRLFSTSVSKKENYLVLRMPPEYATNWACGARGRTLFIR